MTTTHMNGWRGSFLAAVIAAATIACMPLPLVAEEPDAAPAAAQPPASAPAKEAGKRLAWGDDLAAGIKAAGAGGKPVLVRAGAAWCKWCEKLQDEIADPAAQTELGRWTLVYVDTDVAPADARQLGIGPIPALRVVNAAGKVVAAQDGFLTHEELVQWLGEQYGAATKAPADSLLATGPPSARDLRQLIAALRSPTAAERETAIRRLLPYPAEAAVAVVAEFSEPRLSGRLSAIELLEHWRAPITELDPWQPETLTPERLAALATWAESRAAAQPDEPAIELTPDERAVAIGEIARLAATAPAEADASIERLARYRTAILPEVYEAIKTASTDQARQRLTQLRLRLVTTDSLALRWPGGIKRLASGEVAERRAAVTELAAKAAAADEPLLLELFGDSDPLVRELSLKALRSVAGEGSSAALVRLLDDPEPNVRAAVLKQLTETPAPAMVGQISKYVLKEQDADLVVHAIRVLKEVKTPQSTKTLMKLLDHESWQVRAEALEALAGSLEGHSSDPSGSVDIAVALIERLEDPDLFVVSRAIKGLQAVPVESMLKPMAAAAQRHPELTARVVETMSSANELGAKVVPYLREFSRDKNPLVRAEALKGLVAVDGDFDQLLIAAFGDEAPEARMAAVEALQKLLDQSLSEHHRQEGIEFADGSMPVATHDAGPAESLLGKVISLFVPRAKPALADPEGELPADPDQPVDEEMANEEMADDAAKPVEVKRPAVKEPQPEEQALPASAEPAVDESAAADDDDSWLRQYQAGKGRPKWMTAAIEPLEKLLVSADSRERLLAAVALVALGKHGEALPVLETLVEQEPKLRGAAAGALPWLLWPERKPFFDRLLASQPDAGQLSEITTAMGRSVGLRSAEPLWSLLAVDNVDESQISRIHQSLESLYQSQRVISRQGDRRVAPGVLKLWKQLAASGRPPQQIVALSLMINNDAREAAADSARQLFETPEIPESLRADAFQLQLAALEIMPAERLAAAQLASENAAIRKLAARYLTLGSQAAQHFHEGIYLYSQGRMYYSYGSGVAIEISAPKGVKEENIRPLLTDADPEVAACGGYLLATLGKDDGLNRLIDIWRAKGKNGNWHLPLYRAIAALDDDSRTPLLAEIYKSLRDWDRREFYWTIRGMNGPQILKLRKQIRDEVGIETLK